MPRAELLAFSVFGFGFGLGLCDSCSQEVVDLRDDGHIPCGAVLFGVLLKGETLLYAHITLYHIT